MNWIAKWLAAHCEYPEKMDCSECVRVCKVKRRIAEETGCSEALTDELVLGGITHPGIADKLADYMGATARQRDSIVHRKHRGTWTPPLRKERKPKPVEPALTEPKPAKHHKNPHAAAVVALDRLGREIARFESAQEVAEKFDCTAQAIRTRCNGGYNENLDEFRSFGMTFRYAKDWDFMSEEERFASITRCKRRGRTK